MTIRSEYFWLATDQRGEAFIRSFDEVVALPIDAANTALFAVEPAPAFDGEKVLILPGGTVEASETFAETANRELQEELGYRADELVYLGEIRPWSKYLAVRTHVFLARGLHESRLPGDELEAVGIERIPWQEVEAAVARGRVRDARALAAIYLAQRVLAPQNNA